MAMRTYLSKEKKQKILSSSVVIENILYIEKEKKMSGLFE